MAFWSAADRVRVNDRLHLGAPGIRSSIEANDKNKMNPQRFVEMATT
jgi:hypothetical protein